MGTMNIAEEGISLLGAPGSAAAWDGSSLSMKPLQAMRLELEAGILDNIIRSARSGGKGVHLSFGKTITLEYGNRSKQLCATAQETLTEVYSYTADDPNKIAFSALQSHRLAMKKAQEDTVGADVALAKLQNQLAAAEREKQARQIQLAGSDMGLPPATSKRDALKASNKITAMKKNANSQRRPNSTAQSMANSPSLGDAISPYHPETTSGAPVEDAKAQKLKAIRTPLIHFLAVRPVSQNYLVNTLNCDEKDCVEVLERVGRPYRLDPDKWDLSDKAFKELDVWQFNYKTADDRQLAIDRAISSFDRSRLARTHPLWQKLLPIHERGKGKVLSNLNLKDPSQRGATPRINVQSTDESAAARQTPSNDNDTRQDRLAPSDAESKSRPKSGDPIKKTKRINSSVRSVTPKAKEPKKAGQTTKSKEKPQSVTTKKAGVKKGATTVVAKSSEFVHDSDEEDEEEMVDQPAKEKPSTPGVSSAIARKSPAVKPENSAKAKALDVSTKHKVEASRISKVNQQPITPLIKAAEKRPPMSSPASSGSKQATSDGSNSTAKPLPRPRTTSSPHKPSPLGSSPPTNASDLDNDSRPTSSTSSTPLIGHSQAPSSNSAMEKKEPATKGLNSGTAVTGRPLKRKAPADHDEIDSNESGAGPTNGIPLTNGHSTAAKRFKASPISPPTSESSTESSVEAKRRLALEQARRFKTFWAKYQRLYKEVSALPKDTPNRKFDELMKMHERLKVMKAEISRVTLH